MQATNVSITWERLAEKYAPEKRHREYLSRQQTSSEARAHEGWCSRELAVTEQVLKPTTSLKRPVGLFIIVIRRHSVRI